MVKSQVHYGSQPQGYLWGDYGVQASFESVHDLNVWLNRRLVLCHMDLCRRNMILDSTGQYVLLTGAMQLCYHASSSLSLA